MVETPAAVDGLVLSYLEDSGRSPQTTVVRVNQRHRPGSVFIILLCQSSITA